MPDLFQNWIGRSVTRHDVVTERLLAEYRATLKGYLFEPSAGAPPGFHFGLAPAIPGPDELGPDGAERKGLFLPPIGFSRRMWAGGRIDSLAPLHAGAQVVRRSTITGIDYREGKAGAFYLISITHEIEAEGKLAIRDRQDLVFREGGKASGGRAAAPLATVRQWTVGATTPLLFRFSAFTFNGHRIHYDPDFARGVEGYDGLLVHGPLQAAVLFNQAADVLGHVPAVFEYRCLAPLTAGQTFRVDTDAQGRGQITDARGIMCCEARAQETA